MTTPIPSSLSQMILGRPAQATGATAKAASDETATRFNDALSAQKAFFRQAAGNVEQAAPKPAGVTPATFKAADIAQGIKPEETQLMRPGSLLNIRV
ncbi:hypothetical protein PQU92_05205 [Asticcacaulis sp. BYS171W]|uniref:Flagellar hook-basal body complex protein FliE n=1 Tax=Asticcacaulis aquaticus TaxID=2984212 RepID=A0ABT5HRH2_9CAUL|nr:hypothetical protein [Asticcacaulis aquaticus]MDC7682662.1 hypothetical protein [Asticcacaulis aquaticus]